MHPEIQKKSFFNIQYNMSNSKTLMAQPPKAYNQATEELLSNMYLSNVKKRLRQLNQPSVNDMRRWVWELIQNAKDSIAHNPDRDTVDVMIEVSDDRVVFKHNGDPFTPKAQLGLLYKYSQDKDNTQSTGRFGTGFLTTHCLSKIVSIEGDMFMDDTCQDACGFSVTMYRDGLLDKELLDGIKRMNKSLTFFEETSGWTTYTYDVKTDSGKEAIKLGIQNFYDNIAQTMLFCPQLNSVKLNDHGHIVYIERHPVVELAVGVLKASFTIHGSEADTVRSFVYVTSNNHSDELTERYKASREIRLTMAVEVDSENNIVSSNESTTRLYCALPLVGTEEQLKEPVFINCLDFEPDEERQRLLLDGNETTEHTVIDEVTEVTTTETVISECGINRLIYGDITNLFESLVSFLSESEYGNLYYLADGLKSVKKFQDLDDEWYFENVTKKYRSILESYPVVKICNSSVLKKLEEVIFVKEAKDKKDETEGSLYSLLKYIYPNKLIDARSQREWSERAWRGLTIWTIKDLCEDISSFGNWEKLILSGEVLKNWYNSFLTLAKEDDTDNLTDYALLPNMYGDLKKFDDPDFMQNHGVSEVVLDIVNELGYDLREYLLHGDITAVVLPRECNSTSYSALINRLVKAILENRNVSDSSKLSQLAPLFSVFQAQASWDAGFDQLRHCIWHMLNGLHVELFNTDTKLTEDHILKSAWDAADNWVIQLIMSELEEYGSLEALPNNLSISWLNSTLKYLANLASLLFEKYVIVPDQHGDFHQRSKLEIDLGVPSVLKHSIFGNIGVDLKSELLHEGIDGEAIGMTHGVTAEAAAAWIDSCLSKNPDTDVALFILSIMPQNQNTGLYRQQSLIWHLAKLHFPTECLEVDTHAVVELTSETLWNKSSQLIRDKIITIIEEAETLEAYNLFLSGNLEKSITTLNELYSYLVQINLDYRDLDIVPNQKGIFSCMSHLMADNGKILEEAKDASELLLEEADHFRNVLSNVEIVPAPNKVCDLESAYGKLDKKIMEEYPTQASAPKDNYKNGVTLVVEELRPKLEEAAFEHLFPLVNAKYSDVVLNIVWTADDRQKVQKIKKRFEKLTPETQEKFLDKGADVIAEMELQAQQLQSEIDHLRHQLQLAMKDSEDILVVDTEGAGKLSKDEMIAANIEAQAAVKDCLTKQGFVYTQDNGDNYYSTIDGVLKDGVEYPLVVKSHKYSEASFLLSANQWMQLIKPNSMLAVHIGGGNVCCLKLQDLLQTQDKLSFSFNTENLDKANRIEDFARLLHFFTNVQFNFGHLLPNQYTQVTTMADLRFDVRNHSENPAAGSEDLL